MSDENQIVAYIDLLGFTNLVVKNLRGAEVLLGRFYQLSQDTKLNHGFNDLDLFLFSDSLFVEGGTISDIVNYACLLYRRCLQSNINNAEFPLLCRGGIARGKIIHQARNEAPRVQKNFIVSPALAHAAKMETLVKGQRLLIAASEQEAMQHFWNPDIDTITYGHEGLKPSKLFKEYEYRDLLWARDLSMEHDESRDETTALIEIAARLYNDATRTRQAVIHYAETLRICLLSYSGLLQNTPDDRQLINTLITDTLLLHRHPSVWLGFFEMVLSSSEAEYVMRDSEFPGFFQIVVQEEWWPEILANLLRSYADITLWMMGDKMLQAGS